MVVVDETGGLENDDEDENDEDDADDVAVAAEE